MRGGTVCSGIGSPEVAAPWIDWRWCSEIEAFPSAVLKHHRPDVPNLGDMTRFQEWPDDPIDVLVGGTPCQSFSVAGLRKGMADPRGNLALTYLAIAARYRPRWLVWENVPGVLSSNGGRDFGSFLGGLGQLGFGFAYRVLDAQFCRTRGFPWAVPQRRRRVFVVGYLGDWRRAAAVLFDGESLSGNPPPRREATKATASCAAVGVAGSGVVGSLSAAGGTEDGTGRSPPVIASTGDVAHCLNAGGMGRQDYETETMVAFSSKDHGADAMQGVSPTLRAGGHDGSHANAGVPPAVCLSFGAQMSMPQVDADVNQTLQAKNPMAIATPWAVRRLTPTECERLQGFPDGFTDIPWRGKPHAPDGPRYRALGNSMACNAMEWLLDGIRRVDAMQVAA